MRTQGRPATPAKRLSQSQNLPSLATSSVLSSSVNMMGQPSVGEKGFTAGESKQQEIFHEHGTVATWPATSFAARSSI